MKHTILNTIAMLAVAAGLTGCNHKDLILEHDHSVEIDVVFDWRNAPDADPASMSLYMYAPDGRTPLRYMFANRDGGEVIVPYGTYSGIGLNSDDTDWAHTRNTDSADGFEVYTSEADELTAYGLDAVTVPRARGAESERMVATPGMLWSDRVDNIELPEETTYKVITLYPQEAVCHYTVDILDVANLSFLHGTDIDGSISGMSESYLHGKEKASDTSVTMPFVLSMDEDEKSLHAEFLTFGESPDTDNQHMLSVYMILTDGSKWHYTFDVTSQVHDAPDPRHVHIVVHGLTLPHPISSSGGFRPNVNDWQTEHISLSM